VRREDRGGAGSNVVKFKLKVVASKIGGLIARDGNGG